MGVKIVEIIMRFPFYRSIFFGPLLLLLGGVAGLSFGCQGNEVAEPEGKPESVETTQLPAIEGMVRIPGNGDDIPAFLIDATEVTTAEFAAFIEATGYVTEADSFGWSGVFSQEQLAWIPVEGANWRHPRGPAQAPAAPDHPVTQVSLKDARTYARWAGKQLPTEREWLWAATNQGKVSDFPWGEEMLPAGEYLGNWWQGMFPYEDLVEDGYPGIAAVKSFPPTPNGLYDIAGNVWEWTATLKPSTGESVIKGGSFLCSTSYCTGFNLKQRQFTPADSGLNHLGFRCIKKEAASL